MPPKAKKPYVRRLQKCFVPACDNVEGCGKIFLHTPRNPEVLKSWCKAVGAYSGGKCCEDHFELAEDAENWQYFKLCGNGLKIKQGVVPHKYLTTKRPETVSQFSDSDKKLKLEFLSSLVTERKILTRVNRLEDLRVSDGSTNPRDLEELAKTGLARQYYDDEEEEEESTVPTLQVTPDIYLCSCIHEHDQASAESPAHHHRISCSTPTPEVSEYFILGPTTDVPEMEKMEGPVKLPEASPYPTPQILKTLLTVDTIQGATTKPQKTPKKGVEESQESDSSHFESNCSDEDPDYEGVDDYDEPISELKTVPHADERPSKLKSTETESKKIISGTSKSTSTRRKSKKPTGKSRTRPKKKYK